VLASGLLASVRVATGAKTPVVLLLMTAFSVGKVIFRIACKYIRVASHPEHNFVHVKYSIAISEQNTELSPMSGSDHNNPGVLRDL
jgi:hypothetical protein